MVVLARNRLRSALMFVLFIGVAGGWVSAEATLNANDLPAGPVTAPVASDPFTLVAKADKAVTIEALDVARTAADGEVFNARIKLNGGGSADFRAVKVVVTAASKLTVYTNSGSKTEGRILKVVDETGATVAELAAPVDDNANAGKLEASLPKAGTYFLYSGSGGINLYQVRIK
jgi:hypothetical protein